MNENLYNSYGSRRINDRQVDELIGLAHGLVADNKIDASEAEYLYKWLAANKNVVANPIISTLYTRVTEYFDDEHFSEEELGELLETLKSLAGSNYQLGEVQKSSSFPLCDPEPAVEFENRRFCFSGTFASGSRKDCHAVTEQIGASHGGLTMKTNYLVIGEYHTESWAHSSFGRKIEKAVDYRDRGCPINIINERCWLSYLPDHFKKARS